MFGNGMSIVDGTESPYYFPHSLTLFQPSGKKSNYSDNMELVNGYGYGKYMEEVLGQKNYLSWFNMHDRKTVVSTKDEYGGNVSNLTFKGLGSYVLDLATYCPTDLVLEDRWVHFGANEFRSMRAGEIDGVEYVDHRFRIDNGNQGSVGFMFNLYDTFIDGNERILRLDVPKDKHFNRQHLMMEYVIAGIPGMEVQVYANDHLLLDETIEAETQVRGVISHELKNTNIESHQVDIRVAIHYTVDFSKRDIEAEYTKSLKEHGLILNDIRLENDVVPLKEHLTYGDYVNEPGISDEVHDMRLKMFWQVSRYVKDVAYQTVLESPLKNATGSGLEFPNNYATGDLYGDVFVTKSALNPMYDMDIWSVQDKLHA